MLWIVPVSVLRTPGRFDYVGTAGLAIGLTGILLAISRGNEWGWLSAPTLALGLGGIAVLLVWGWFELRIAEPLLDLRIAARRPVLLTNLASIGMGFALFSSNVVFPQILELPGRDRRRLRPLAHRREPHRDARRARDDGALARLGAPVAGRRARACC